MGFDGVFRPNQVFGYGDAVGYRNAADRAAAQHQQAGQVLKNEHVKSIGEEDHGNPQEERSKKRQMFQDQQDPEFEDDLKALLLEQFQLVLDESVVYRFALNHDMDTIDLINTATLQVMLRLTPEQFIALTEKTRKYNGGAITDRTA